MKLTLENEFFHLPINIHEPFYIIKYKLYVRVHFVSSPDSVWKL